MKKLSLFAALLCACMMSFAAEEVVYTLNYANAEGTGNGYASTYDVTINNVEWNVPGNATMDPARIGGKSLDGVDRVIYSKTAIADNITKVVVDHGTASGITVNSVTLSVYASAADAAAGTNAISTVDGGTFAASTKMTFARPESADWTGRFYRLVYNVTVTGSSNKFVEFKKAEFYAAVAEIAATGIELDQTAVTLPQYREVQLVATLTPAGANTAVVWASDNENVEVVEGLVKAKAASGTATITATAGEGVSATCAITLAEAPVLTCADAAAKAASVSANNENYAGGQYVVRGYVTETFTNASFTTEGEYVSFYMDDAEGTARTLEVYKAAWATVAVGDYVEAVGYLTKYNTTNEMAAGGKVTVLPKPIRGAYNIGGENADYTSLYAACQDINARGIVGDVELLICADLTETKNPALTNPTDFTITIRPNADADRTISLTQSADNDGPSGGFTIGGVENSNNMIDWGSALTKNVIIDGYAEGGETRRLTFDTPSGFGSGAGPVLFYGDVRDSKIINCIIRNTRGATGITVRTQQNSDIHPERIVIENNIITPGGTASAGIAFNGTKATTKGVGAPKDCIVRNNEITATNRGIFLDGVNGLLVEGNSIQMPNAASGYNAHAVMGNSGNMGNIVIRANKINVATNNFSAKDYGVIGVGTSGLAANQEVQWVVENNYFYGLDALNANAANAAFKMYYVRCGNATIIRHNTFYIPVFTNKPGMPLATGAYCTSAVYMAGAAAYEIQNNIFVCEETEANVSFIRGNIAENTNVANNVFHHNGGNAAILAGTVVAADSAAYFADGANAGSKWKLPVFANAAIGDLEITTADADLLMPRLADVLVDITGADRRENTYAGAFEGPEPSPATAIDAVKVEGIQKIFRNGEVLIIRDGKTYNMMGQIVE